MLTIALANQKGGVAKTTSTINLGSALAEHGKRVLLVDMDPQGNLAMIAFGREFNPHSRLSTSVYNVLIGSAKLSDIILKVRDGLDIAPSNINLSGAEVELLNEIGRESILRDALAPLDDRYDFAIIDCPPALGVLTINGLTAADMVIIPVECKDISTKGIPLLLNTIQKIKARSNPDLHLLGILPTRFDSRTAHSREVLEALQGDYNKLVLDIVIKERVSLADAGVGGQSIIEFDPASDVARGYRQLATEVLAHAN